MNVRVRWVALAGFIAGAATISSAQGTDKPSPGESAGLEIGSPAPKFSLTDQLGETRTLEELLKKGKVALVFYRSADW